LSAYQQKLDLHIKNTTAQKNVTRRKKKQSKFQAWMELERQAQQQCLQSGKPSSRPQPHGDPPQDVKGPPKERASLGEGVENAYEKGGAAAFKGSLEREEKGQRPTRVKS
jgi:hypothetical protein